MKNLLPSGFIRNFVHNFFRNYFRIMKRIALFLSLIVCVFTNEIQAKETPDPMVNVRGLVYDAYTEYPLSNAKVQVKDSTGTILVDSLHTLEVSGYRSG